MAINLKCSCGRVLSFLEQDVGKRARCPACGSSFVIPQVVNSPVPEQAAPYGPAPYDPARSRQLATQAKFGLSCGFASIFFFVLIFVVSIAMTGGGGKGFDDGFKRGYNASQQSPAAAVIATCSWGASILCSILAIVFGALGRRKENTQNRGSGTAGLVMGIVMAGLNCCFGILVMGVVMALLSHASPR